MEKKGNARFRRKFLYVLFFFPSLERWILCCKAIGAQQLLMPQIGASPLLGGLPSMPDLGAQVDVSTPAAIVQCCTPILADAPASNSKNHESLKLYDSNGCTSVDMKFGQGKRERRLAKSRSSAS
eukprot:6483637-Amphidinium_carterae.1